MQEDRLRRRQRLHGQSRGDCLYTRDAPLRGLDIPSRIAFRDCRYAREVFEIVAVTAGALRGVGWPL